jgi:hypothetical protein
MLAFIASRRSLAALQRQQSVLALYATDLEAAIASYHFWPQASLSSGLLAVLPAKWSLLNVNALS